MSEHYKLCLINKTSSIVKTIDDIFPIFEYDFDKELINIGDVKSILERLDELNCMLEAILIELNNKFTENL